MKKLAIAAVLALSGLSAQADTGPIFIYYPGYCNAKELYINQNGDIYGYERGCSASFGLPLFGTQDQVSGNIYVSSNETPSEVCLQNYAADGYIRGGCSNGRQYRYGVPIRYVVSFDAPQTTRSNAKELPPMPR